MVDRQPYPDRLREDTEALIGSLQLEELQKHFLRSRWLDQVLWMEGRALRCRRRYYVLRLVTALGGVVLPVLVSVSTTGETAGPVHVVTIVLSLVVAMAVATEAVMRYGDKYRQYRRTVELLKSEGWNYFQLSGRYRRHGSTHRNCYPLFAARVEGIIEPSVEMFVAAELASEKGGKQPEEAPAGEAVAPRRWS